MDYFAYAKGLVRHQVSLMAQSKRIYNEGGQTCFTCEGRLKDVDIEEAARLGMAPDEAICGMCRADEYLDSKHQDDRRIF